MIKGMDFALRRKTGRCLECKSYDGHCLSENALAEKAATREFNPSF